MSVPTSDSKSEFLYQSSSIVHDLQTSPWTTSYAWDISHAPVTTYHLYSHSPSALTEYLKQKLRYQRAKRLGRSLSAQVKQSVQLERNSWKLSAGPQCICLTTDAPMGRAFQEFGEGTIPNYIHTTKTFQSCNFVFKLGFRNIYLCLWFHCYLHTPL